MKKWTVPIHPPLLTMIEQETKTLSSSIQQVIDRLEQRLSQVEIFNFNSDDYEYA